MAWKACVECKRTYNDTKGGCTNSACTMFGQPAAVSGSSPISTPQPKPQPRPVVVQLSPSFTVKPKPVLPSSVVPVIASPPILQWHQPVVPPTPTQIPPMAIPLTATNFTLTCYRGEKSEWWPPPKTRLACGMTLRKPWAHTTMTELWNELVKDMRTNGGGTPAGYAQYLRAEGRIYALATARTTGGAFEGYNYEIQIPNARTFLWGSDFTLGPPANFTAVGKTTKETRENGKLKIVVEDKVTDDYIVLNADTVAASTILAFGHKTGTYEVTFFHDLPIGNIVKCSGQTISTMQIMTKPQVEGLPDGKENNWAKALLR